jgi:hypothetical protein
MWQEIIYNREEWKKLLRKARDCRILHVSKELMNDICCMFPNIFHSVRAILDCDRESYRIALAF